jgi:hypothetical protein
MLSEMRNDEASYECRDFAASDFNELRSCLERLGSPAPGRVRVFRGQTRRYRNEGHDVLLSARHRRGALPIRQDWVAAAQNAIFGQSIPRRIPREYEETWLPAVLQHYGPGSFYLDVTGDPRIAVWFALNSFRSCQSEAQFFVSGAPYSLTINWSWYEPIEFPFTESHEPIIYVFDVLRWPGIGQPCHGDLVAVSDLRDGQRLFHRATRLESQSACLVYASPHAFFGPDLGRQIRARICLTHDFQEQVSMFRLRDLFPAPSNDPCYSVLLALPLNPSSRDRGETSALEIPCYVSSHPPRNDEADEFVCRLHTRYGI